MATSKDGVEGTETPTLDQCLLGLAGPAKLRALQAARGVTNIQIACIRGAHAQMVAQMLSGERENAEVREAYSEVLGVPLEEVNAALAVVSHRRRHATAA